MDKKHEAVARLVSVALGHGCCYGSDKDLEALEMLIVDLQLWDVLSPDDRQKIGAWQRRNKLPSPEDPEWKPSFRFDHG